MGVHALNWFSRPSRTGQWRCLEGPVNLHTGFRQTEDLLGHGVDVGKVAKRKQCLLRYSVTAGNMTPVQK